MPARRAPGGRKPKKNTRPIPEEDDENVDNDDEMALMENPNLGAADQLQLTAEQKEQPIIKNLTSSNPQAPHNLCTFSF
jgi:hypothetical protein